MKLAVVMFNLGGPDCLEAVQPFLQNLFSDPAIRAFAARKQPLAGATIVIVAGDMRHMAQCVAGKPGIAINSCISRQQAVQHLADALILGVEEIFGQAARLWIRFGIDRLVLILEIGIFAAHGSKEAVRQMHRLDFDLRTIKQCAVDDLVEEDRFKYHSILPLFISPLRAIHTYHLLLAAAMIAPFDGFDFAVAPRVLP